MKKLFLFFGIFSLTSCLQPLYESDYPVYQQYKYWESGKNDWVDIDQFKVQTFKTPVGEKTALRLIPQQDGLPSSNDGYLRAAQKAAFSIMSEICAEGFINLDSAAGGIDEELMLGLGGISGRSMHILTDGSYGKAFAVHEEPLDSFVARVKARFQTERVVVYGTRPVKKVASFCGAGMDDETVAFALAEGADTFVSSDAKHHHIAALVEHGVNVVLLTHYAAENYGFVRFAENLKNKLKGLPVTVFTDERLL